ncbi:MAG: polysaccharide pyruvyl transferase family protein [Deltaproteobacteria bacterium]
MRLAREAAAHAAEFVSPAPGMLPAESATIRAAQAPPARIAFFGNFGTQNLGNEYTLKAILAHARRRLPDAELLCICTGPQDVAARHGVTAIPMSYRYSGSFRAAAERMSQGRVVRALRRLFVRVPRELAEVVRAFRCLRGVRMLVMTGTGMLSDVGIGPFDLHWEILKWSAVAKLRGARVTFASVGMGPIASAASRRIVRWALSLADYRSFRDAWSRSYLESLGFDASRDRVYPDLALSLPPLDTPRSGLRPAPSTGARRVVGVGLMDYYGTHVSSRVGEDAYRAYVAKMTRFVSWLLERGYDVRLLIGDLCYDTRSKDDVLRGLSRCGAPTAGGRVVIARIGSVEELVQELAGTDLVVAMRFHTALLALMLERPVIALSYHQKCVSLMDSVGLPQYAHDIDRGETEQLVEQFTDLETNSDRFAPSIAGKLAECRRALDEQYAALFALA